MSDKRRGLGRGLGALIPSAPATPGTPRPSDVFFAEQRPAATVEDRAADSSEARFTGNQQDTPGDDGAAPQTPDDDRAADTDVTAPAEDAASSAAAVDAAAVPAGEGLAPVPGATFAEIPLAAIRPNPRQPRTVFAEEEMDELVASIREIGVLQPVVVRPVGDGEGEVRYELVMGERRWRASGQAGQQTVPAIVRDTTDEDLLRDALLENLHRAQLNPLEEAAAYQQLLEDFGCTHDELATRIGRSRPQISNMLRLLKLPALVQRRVAAGVLSAGHARALLGLGDAAAMERLAQRIVAEGLSVRSVEEIVTLGMDDEPKQRSARGPAQRDPQLEDLAASMSDQLDTRVKLQLGKHKGRMTVEFASVDDLHRIIELLGLKAGQ
ncbi:ParB family chromosome partitioning protein [Barrientosiimonas humi]|uniref:ParB family chromosome partitioning protein n=2 Tax=Barrientosiimonas TaxID=1535207 RepID=A0A542XG55_9MICO|nr:ParB/RepB/Spo0J family partition protein [Barrientosiimonas humi]TQL34790.1 ParB family chromosome partitioning protein [Barrientosiimonas humi]CAG7570893.1 putative chromosome-partitioning protein ParB [Barrientosiimonas humi]